MPQEITGTICSKVGAVFNCKCDVEVGEDGETAWIQFPQLVKDTDNISPLVYATMDGTQLAIRLCDRDDIQLEFVWDEDRNKWIQREVK